MKPSPIKKNPPEGWNPKDDQDEFWLGCKDLLNDSNQPIMPTKDAYNTLWKNIREELEATGDRYDFLNETKQNAAQNQQTANQDPGKKSFGNWLDVLIFDGGPYAQLSRFAAVFLLGFLFTQAVNNPERNSDSEATMIASGISPMQPNAEAADQEEPANSVEPKTVTQVPPAKVHQTTPEPSEFILPVDSRDLRFELNGDSQLAMQPLRNSNLQGFEYQNRVNSNFSNSPFAKQRLLNSLQQMKFDSYVENNPEELNRIRELESNVAILLRDDRSVPDSEVYGIELFQTGDRLLQEKNYAEAIRYFEQSRELVPGSFLAFLAQFQIATVKFEYLQQFDDALSVYRETLEQYPAHFLTSPQKRYIISQVNLLENNQDANWAALSLWIEAKHGSSKVRDESLVKIIESHSSVPLASQAAGTLAEELLAGTCMLTAAEVLELLQQASSNPNSGMQASSFKFYEAEILFRKLFQFKQAAIAYQQVVELPGGIRYEAQVNNRIAQLNGIRQ
ncbi:MAG: tetratricopeptide repeat protein [Sumerlaeia bacterium]